MALSDDLERIAVLASVHGEVAAVLAAEPADGARCYVVALAGPRWLVMRDDGEPVTRREDVRAAASIVAMCEVAADAAADLGTGTGEPPWVARPALLDEIGASMLGRREFTDALRAGTAAVDEFAREVERGYAVPLG
jgi:hypothetical protein